MNRLVSVVVPVYNCEKYLQKCIDSILGQTYRNIELILVDDGSRDNSGIICDEALKKDKRVKVIHNQNKGVSYSRNCGINESSGKFITFVDSDDWLENNAVESLVSILIQNDADVCFCTQFYKDENKLLSKIELVNGVYDQNQIFSKHIRGGFISSCWSSLFETRIAKAFPFAEDVHMLEDWLFDALAILSCDRVAVMDTPIYHYRTNTTSVSHTRLDEKKISCFKIVNKLKPYAQKYDFNTAYAAAFIINSTANILTNSNYSKCKKEARILKNEARKSLCDVWRLKDISLNRKICVLLCAIHPRLYCLALNVKRLYK